VNFAHRRQHRQSGQKYQPENIHPIHCRTLLFFHSDDAKNKRAGNGLLVRFPALFFFRWFSCGPWESYSI